MLKTVGTVAAGAAAGLFIMSPFGSAFADEESNGINVGQDNNIVVPVQACGDQIAVVGAIVPVLSSESASCTSNVAVVDESGGKGKGKGKRREGGGEEFNGINVLNDNNIAVPIQACNDQISVVGLIIPVGSASESRCNAEIAIKDASGGDEEFNGINLINDNNIVIPVQVCGDQVAVLGAIIPILSPLTAACNSAAAVLDH